MSEHTTYLNFGKAIKVKLPGERGKFIMVKVLGYDFFCKNRWVLDNKHNSILSPVEVTTMDHDDKKTTNESNREQTI